MGRKRGQQNLLRAITFVQLLQFHSCFSVLIPQMEMKKISRTSFVAICKLLQLCLAIAHFLKMDLSGATFQSVSLT